MTLSFNHGNGRHYTAMAIIMIRVPAKVRGCLQVRDNENDIAIAMRAGGPRRGHACRCRFL